MTLIEKAKKYDQAINAIKKLKENYPTAHVIKDWIKENFPELLESEDEKIKKEIINYINFAESNNLLRIDDYEKKKGWIAWLEKQKSTEWNNEDKKIFNQIVSIIEDSDLVRAENISIYTNWLKSRVQPQLNWRPTELQIEALESATENCAYSEYQDCLKELIKQLKQL